MNNTINVISNDVDTRLSHIFNKRLNIDISSKNKSNLLMGSKIGLSARDLVYICLNIEKEFDVTIDDQCIENYTLTTFENIKEFILSNFNYVR